MTKNRQSFLSFFGWCWLKELFRNQQSNILDLVGWGTWQYQDFWKLNIKYCPLIVTCCLIFFSPQLLVCRKTRPEACKVNSVKYGVLENKNKWKVCNYWARVSVDRRLWPILSLLNGKYLTDQTSRDGSHLSLLSRAPALVTAPVTVRAGLLMRLSTLYTPLDRVVMRVTWDSLHTIGQGRFPCESHQACTA